MRTVKENVNGWDIVAQSQWVSNEGETCSPYGTHPDHGTGWAIKPTGKYVKQNRHNGCVFGKVTGGAWDTIEEAEEHCNAWPAGRLSPGD